MKQENVVLYVTFNLTSVNVDPWLVGIHSGVSFHALLFMGVSFPESAIILINNAFLALFPLMASWKWLTSNNRVGINSVVQPMKHFYVWIWLQCLSFQAKLNFERKISIWYNN